MLNEVELNENEVIEDMLIDGLKIVQNTTLYRFTSDSVLLSRFARAKVHDVVADFCSGSGIVGFNFYAINRKEKPDLQVVLFEMQKSLADLSKKTIELNGFENFKVENVKLQEIPNEYNGKFSLILCNPPYERGGFDNISYEKAICRKEITITLKEIAKASEKALKYGGRLCILNRADRLAELCYTLKECSLEVKRIQFVVSKVGQKPYLVMVEAVKGGKPQTEIMETVVNDK